MTPGQRGRAQQGEKYVPAGDGGRSKDGDGQVRARGPCPRGAQAGVRLCKRVLGSRFPHTEPE